MEEEWKCMINGCVISESEIKSLSPEQLISFVKELLNHVAKLQQEEEEMLSRIMEVKLRRLGVMDDES